MIYYGVLSWPKKAIIWNYWGHKSQEINLQYARISQGLPLGLAGWRLRHTRWPVCCVPRPRGTRWCLAGADNNRVSRKVTWKLNRVLYHPSCIAWFPDETVGLFSKNLPHFTQTKYIDDWTATVSENHITYKQKQEEWSLEGSNRLTHGNSCKPKISFPA